MFRGTESFNLTRTVKYVVNPGAPNDIPEMVEVTAYNLVYPANVEECVQACKNLELEIIETWSTEAAENRRQYPFTEFIYRHDSTCECFSSAEIEDGGHYPAYVTNENTDYTSGLIQPKAGTCTKEPVCTPATDFSTTGGFDNFRRRGPGEDPYNYPLTIPGDHEEFNKTDSLDAYRNTKFTLVSFAPLAFKLFYAARAPRGHVPLLKILRNDPSVGGGFAAMC